MTEHTPGNAVEAPDTPAQEDQQEPDTFPRTYVEELRREAAGHRTRAQRADKLAEHLVRAYAETTGKLADPSDLPMSDELLDDGIPNREKVLAAVDELLARKPHLAATRPIGDVGQGARGEAAAMVSLAELLRSGAG